MATRRKAIRLNEHERQALVSLYLRRRIPIDQYERRPADLKQLCDQWRGLCKRSDGDGEILHYMRNERKHSKWVVFDGKHKVAPPVSGLTPEETESLIAIYRENVAAAGEGSDNIAYDNAIAKLIQKRFAEETGRMLPAHELVAKLTAIRKRGLLPQVQKTEMDAQDDGGFSDINNIV